MLSSVSRLLLASVLVFTLAGASAGSAGTEPAAAATEKQLLERFRNVLRAVRQSYVHGVDAEKLVDAALDGMLQSLDAYSRYMPPKGYQALRNVTKGHYGGVGVELRQHEAGVLVMSVIDGTPAARAGLRPNDLITHADGEPLAGRTQSEIDRIMRGQVGTQVVLTIRRAGAVPTDYTLARAMIQDVPVTYQALGNVGVIRVSQFNRHVSQAVREAALRLRKGIGPEIAGYVLDLRDNPGGLIKEAVRLADLFLEAGPIVTVQGRAEGYSGTHAAKPGDIARGVPLAVVVNGGSASASEIVAGALRDHRRAIVVGERTYGKGSVQTIMGFDDGYGIKLTTAYYYTPRGHAIDRVGLNPDIAVASPAAGTMAEGGDPQLEAAAEALNDLRGAPAVVASR